MRKGLGSAFATVILAALILSLFAFSLLIPDACASDRGEEKKSNAPAIEVSAIQGRLDLGSPSTIAVLLLNNASDQGDAAKMDPDPAKACSITAELVCDDGRIQLLSGPQMAGSLSPGESTAVEFMALAEGAEVGIHPARLRLGYTHLERVSISGEEEAPYIIFNYEELSRELPLPLKVALGPRIEIEEMRGEAIPGERSVLEVVLANRGDESAFDLQLRTKPIPPFLKREDSPAEEEPKRLASLEAGSMASISLMVFTDANATAGYAPLPCSISYQTAALKGEGEAILPGGEREEEIALLVDVKERSYPWAWPALPAAAAFVLVLAAGLLYYRRNISPGSSRRRRRR